LDRLMAETIWQIFAEAAREYDAWFDEHRFVYESELLALRGRIAAGGLGLEIGAGSGRFAVPLGLSVGVEPAPAMAELARRRGLRVVRALAEALPFGEATFDLVAMITVLCFLGDPFQALAEATRVLKPGGQILIGMIDGASPLGRSYETHKQESKFYRQARFYPVSQALAWLEELAYGQAATCQTIFGDLSSLASLEQVREGHGEGGFVVISARKTR
jgi:ubiquinone/menaquinone biosynthesis C-methylase UbiE